MACFGDERKTKAYEYPGRWEANRGRDSNGI